jgi:hypothetical protein
MRAHTPDEVWVLLQQLRLEKQESQPPGLQRLRLRHGRRLLHPPEKVLPPFIKVVGRRRRRTMMTLLCRRLHACRSPCIAPAARGETGIDASAKRGDTCTRRMGTCGSDGPVSALIITLYFFARIVRLTSVSWHSRSRRPCSTDSERGPATAARCGRRRASTTGTSRKNATRLGAGWRGRGWPG